MTSTTLNIIGLITNIVGTIILAFSLNKYIRSIRMAIDAHELFIKSICHPTKPVIQVTGTNSHMNRDKKIAAILSWLGVGLVLLGFIFQLASYIK
ncbi:hypothetical protein [Flavobacterium sp. LC2016-01]|uniref:hypothetical protein n=1 Tax=Flavobacterium sp. LC2016-01 TaxID=2675876 RepID=UPI0012BA9F41|nr:hypothetical protein [Flavobacterium sp. LC2016-01]MTH14148.1 hypothetical protein [Flavobacterium sp. LC2016-01]